MLRGAAYESPMDKLAPFIEQLRKTGRISVIAGVIFALFGGGLFFIPAKTSQDLYIKLGIMAFFVLFGVVLVVIGLQDPTKHKALVTLQSAPKDVVWVYVQQVRRNGQHVASNLTLALASGKALSLPLQIGREKELQAVALDFVPHAHVGFDPAIEAQWKRDPASLRAQQAV
jgi:hypothetical protein